MLVAAPEFGTLLPSYDLTFLNVLNDVYDCRNMFEDGTRKTGGIKIDRPHINLIGGTQPKYLGEILPESAYGMGFCSRIIMIYAGQRIITKMFKNKGRNKVLHKNLLTDLKEIANLCGEFEWEQEAQDEAEAWDSLEITDGPQHSLLQHYNSRRVRHGIKLAMVLSAARGSDLIVTYKDFMDTKALLLQAEEWMPEVFKEMSSSSDSNEMEEIQRFAFHYCKKYDVDVVPEHKIVHFMSSRIPVSKTTFFIDAMINSKILNVVGVNMGSGKRMFKPVSVSIYDK